MLIVLPLMYNDTSSKTSVAKVSIDLSFRIVDLASIWIDTPVGFTSTVCTVALLYSMKTTTPFSRT